VDDRIEPASAELVLWRQLVATGCRAGARYEDAQDLASRTIHQALAAHDPSRGPFAPFCRTIHANLLKNHWRDRKPVVEFDPENDDRVVPIDPHGQLEIQEGQEMLRDIAEKILAGLDPAEAALFLVLADLCRESERAAVSEASRRLGLDPQRGWDLFRRIQRKARGQVGEFRNLVGAEPQALSADLLVRPMESYAPAAPPEIHADACAPAPRRARRSDDGAVVLMLSAFGLTAGHERFAASLTSTERERLAALLS
jgi:DNA-directed RNA polymerase specialized sigma24 family protein